MSSTASKLGLVLTDTGASGSDRRTSNGDLDILGLLIGNTSLDVSKLNSTNTSIDTKELVGEGGTYTGVPGTLIAYGKTGNNSWSYRLVPASGQLAINNGVFGDPLYSVYKYAYIATSSLAPGGATQAFWQFSTNGGASWSASQTVGVKNTIKLNEGDYKDGQVQIRQVDATGKVLNTLSDFGAFTVDKTAPTPSIIDLGGADKTFSTQVGDNVIKGRAEAGLKVNIFAKESKFEDFSSGQLPSWIKFDIPNPSIANINFDAKNGELDFDAKGGRTNLWTSRDNSPFAYVSRPTVALGETWFIETTVRLDARNQGGSLAGITFYDDKNGSFQYGAPQFALDGWNTKGGKNVSLQTLGNGSFFNTTSGTNSGPSSAALDFDGRDDFISVPTTSPLPGGNSTYTLEAWIKPDVHATNGIVGWGPWGSGNSVNALRLGTGGTIHNYWWGNDLIVQSGISLTDGKWHHVAATFDGTTRSIYVDGVLKGSDKPKGHNASTTTNNLRIGSTNNGEYFDGSIDDVAIWNKALSQQEITARQTTPPIGSESGLVAFYGLNETTGNSVSSQGSAATLLTGTLTNGPIRTTRSNASSTGATSISGETAQVNLRVEVTENGKADLYTFYYRAKDTDGWSQLGTSTSFEIDNARAALFYKTDGAKAGLASFDNVKVGKLTDVLLGQADVTADGKFEYTLSEKDIQTLGEGLQKEIYASQTDLAGNTGRSASLMAAVDTVATPVVITSIGTKDNVVSMLKEEQGKGAVKYKLDQYTGFQSNNLATLRDYVAKFNPNADPNKKLATVYTDTIDFTDDQGGFAGDLPFDRRWPAAELANAWGTGGINNTFFARITTDFYIEDAQKYRFRTYNDDGVFLLVDDKLIISDTGYHPEARFYGDIDLGKGNHTLELFFFEAGGEASLELGVSKYDPIKKTWSDYKMLGKNDGIVAKSEMKTNNVVNGTGERDSLVTISLGELTLGATVTDSQGIFTYNLTQQNIEAIGTNPGKTVSASQKDSSGNISSSAPIAAKTPVKPPEFSVLQLGGDDSTVTTIDGDSVLSGKANPNTKTTISLNGKLLAEVTSDALGLFKYSLSPQDIVSLGQGVNKKLIVSQTDLYGQVGSKDFIFSVDTIAPTLSLKGQMGGVDKTVSSLPLDNIITGMTDERLLTLAFGNQVLTTITPDRIGAFQLSLDASIISKVGEGISKVFNLFAVDGVGNKTSIEFTCDIDITPPAKPGNLSVGGHDSTISLKSGDNILTSKVEANTSLYVYSDTVLIANFVVAPDASLTSYQFTNDQLKSIGDGSHELVLKSVDKAGNFSLSDSLLYTIDRTPPTLVFNGKLGGADETISTQLSDNLVFGNTDASSYQLVYDNQVISEKSVNSNGQIALEISSDLIDIIGQGDNKLLTVLVSDKAGNETSKQFVFAVDTIPPNPPVISSVGGLDSTLTTFSKDNIISGSSDPNSVVSLFVDYKFLADVKCDSKGIFSLALSKDNILSLGDGLGKVLTAKVSDIAGNTSFSNQFSFSVDTTPPPAPVILSVGGTDSTISTAGSLNNMPTVDNKIVGTSEALTTVSFFNSKGVLLGSTNADSNGKFEYAFTSSNISSLGQGAKKVVSAVARDSVGYSSISSASLEFNIDTIAPNAPLIKSVGGADNIITLQPSDNTIQGSSSPGDTVNLKAVSTTGFSLDLGTVLVSNTGLFSFALSVDQIKQIDGANASLIQASVTDVAGNVGRSTFNLDVDITPPQIVFNQIGGIDNVVSSVVGDATIRGSADPVSKVVIGSGSRVFGEVTSLADGSFSYNLSSTDISFLGQGLARSIYASQFDRAGNFSKQFGSFAVDTIAPAIPLVKSVGGIDSIVTSNLGDRSVVVSADRDTTIDIVYVSGSSRSVLSSMAVGSSGTVTYELSASDLESIRQGVGKAIQVNARDAAGNASTSRPLSFSVEASWNKGSSTDDSLNFKSGLDVLTGLGGSNTFKVDKLTSAIAVSTMSQLSFDRITDFKIGIDSLDAPVSASARELQELGRLQALTFNDIGNLLNTGTNFKANSASTFTYDDQMFGSRTFLALNDSNTKFSSLTDSIIEITGYSGDLSLLAVV